MPESITDFPTPEFETRLANAQTLMREQNLDAMFFCTEPEVRYFTGFRTLFWQSPTRPWYLIVPAIGDIIAIIPRIGAALMRTTWVRDIRTWDSPAPDDDGLSLLMDALNPYQSIGMLKTEEASLRMPPRDFEHLQKHHAFKDCSPLVKSLRTVKSPAEIAIIEEICAIGSASFAKFPDLIDGTDTLQSVFRKFRIALLENGADDVPYLVGGLGQGGYDDVISPPTAQPIKQGDVLMLDTGATLRGYFCDFDRNFAIGRADEATRSGYKRLWDATQAGLEFARPDVTCAELFGVMNTALGLGDTGSDVGRFGHGLGMQLTEYPSLAPFDNTVLRENMVMTLEPSLTLDNGKIMVHEENIVITKTGARLLTTRAAPELPEVT